MKKINGLIGAWLAVIAVYFSGQNRAFAAEEDLSLSDIFNLTVTVASKSAETVSDAASSVTVFTAADIRRLGVRNIEELLDFVPGFQAYQFTEGPNSFGSRVAVRGQVGSNAGLGVLFMVDGQRVNDANTNSASRIAAMFPVEWIDQIEVIRGPGSALYGSNAFFGVVSIKTKKGKSDATLYGGNAGQRNGAVNFSKQLGDLKVSAFVRAQQVDGTPFEHIEDASVSKGGKQLDDHEKISTAAFDADLNLEYKNASLSAGFLSRNLQGNGQLGYLSSFPPLNNAPITQSFVNGKYHGVLQESLELDAGLGYQHVIDGSAVIAAPAELMGAEPFFSLSKFVSHREDASLDLHWKALHSSELANELVSGLLYEESRVDQSSLYANYDFPGGIPTLAPYPYVGEYFNQRTPRRGVFGAYFSDKWTFFNMVSLTLGGRYDRYSDFGGSFNPRTALVYSTPWNGKAKVMYGQAFRAPTFVDLQQAVTHLDPEKIRTLEFAYVQELKQARSLVTATYYNSRISDSITPVQDPNILAVVVKNSDQPLYSSGLEFEVQTKPVSMLTGNFAFAHSFTAALPVPRTSFSFGLSYDLMESVQVGFTGLARSSLSAESWEGEGRYFVGNITTKCHVFKDLSLDLGVYNVTDREYHATSTIMPHGTPQWGRTYIAGLHYAM